MANISKKSSGENENLKINRISLSFFLFIFLRLIYFLLESQIRYVNQGIPIKLYSFWKFSNYFSVLEFSLIITLFVISYKKKPNLLPRFYFFSISLSLLSIIVLLYGQYQTAQLKEVMMMISLYLDFPIIILFLLLFLKDEKLLYFKSMIGSVLLLIVYISAVIGYILFYQTKNDHLNYAGLKGDIAVVFGAAVWGKNRPSPVFKERILKSLELYQRKIVPKIAVTGGFARGEISEAEVARNFLIKENVPISDIFLENKSSSTIEQVHFIRDYLCKMKKMRNIIAVSDFFHLRRISEICIFNNINVIGISSNLPSIEENTFIYVFRESIGLILFWKFGV
jgi:uncharacterized SAM-binding protein YcdF (DUF218 family)